MTELLQKLQQVEAKLMTGVFDSGEGERINRLRSQCVQWLTHEQIEVQVTAASILYWLGIDTECEASLLDARERALTLLHRHPSYQSPVADELLQGWERLDWHRIYHAYGQAVDVPIHLKALCAQKESIRERGLSGIVNNVYHLGGYSQAVPFTIQFLLRLLTKEYPYPETQVNIIQVLVNCFADGKTLVHSKIKQALREGLLLYLPYLQHEEIEVQDLVIELLGKVGGDHPLAHRVLMDRIEWAEWGYQRSLALYAFGYLQNWSPEHTELVTDWMRTDPSPERRRDAAVAIIFYHEGRGPAEAWETVLNYVLHHQLEPSESYPVFIKWWRDYLYDDLPLDIEGIIYRINEL